MWVVRGRIQDRPRKEFLPSLHPWLGHAVVLLQSLTVHAPRYVYVRESVFGSHKGQCEWQSQAGRRVRWGVPNLSPIHNIDRSTDKPLRSSSRHCLGTHSSSRNVLDRALCRSHRASSTAAEPAVRANGTRRAQESSCRNAWWLQDI